MKYKRRIFVSIFWILLGAGLLGCALFGVIDDFWSGMGGGLLAVGVLQLVKYIRYFKDTKYREEVDTAANDERNKFISGQAHAWAAYIYVIAAAIATVGFKMAGYDEISLFASVSLCFVVVVYAVAYFILSKKY